LKRLNSKGEIILNLKDKLSKKPWPYWVGGIILALLNILLLFTTGVAWKISTSFLYVGTTILGKMGIEASEWYYFNVYGNELDIGETFLNNRSIVMAVAMIVGALISVLFVSEFKFKIQGVVGAIAALLGTIIPSFLIILVVASSFSYFRNIPIVDNVFKGITGAVPVLVLIAVKSLSKSLKKSTVNIIIIVICVVSIAFFNVHPVIMIFLSAIYGIFFSEKEVVENDDIN